MAVRLVTAILARNEAGDDRYLREVLTRCKEFSDEILVLDDNSTDETPDIVTSLGCIVADRSTAAVMWGEEATARTELWNHAAYLADGGWVLICDADMILRGDPRKLCESWSAGSWAFPLVDLWDSRETFRVDGPWGFGPTTPRPWLFRAPKGANWVWGDRAIHAGHAPLNHAEIAGPCFAAPPDVYWEHLGWLKREHRERKAAQYASVSHQMTEFERAHAATILD